MANSENSSSVENSDSQEILSSEPLGNNNPLLPQFLLPLGAQSLSILQPKLFSPKLIDEISGIIFEDSPFFDEFAPQISAKTEAQQIQRNSEIIKKQPELSTSVKSVNPTQETLSHDYNDGNSNEYSSFGITTQPNPIDIINREHDEVKTPLATEDDEIYSTSTEIIPKSEIKNDFSGDTIQKQSQSSTSAEISNQAESGIENTTFTQEIESTTPHISQSPNLNQLQTSLSPEVVDDNNLVKQQATEIISKSPSSTSAEISNQVEEGFNNTTFPQESESTTPQISQSDNLNQLQTSLSSEAVDGNNLVKQQATDIINKSQSSTPEITHQVEAGFKDTTFPQESELTTPQISQSDNLNQLQTSLSSEAVDDSNLVKQQATDIINKSSSSTSAEITHQVEAGFSNTTFPQESESTTPQISQSNNLNKLQPSLSSEAVDDNNLVKQQATDIINKSSSSASAEISNQVEAGFKNTTFSQEIESTTPQISQSNNLNQLQTSLSSEAVDDNNLVKQQATDTINKSSSSASAEISNQVEAGFNNTTFPQESESTTPQISQSDNLNQLQTSLSSEAVDGNNLVKQQATDIINKSPSSASAEITNQAESEIENTTFPQEIESTTPQISQSDNLNQLQTSLSSEAVDDNNLVKQQATEIINKSQYSTPEITHQVEAGFNNTNFSQEIESTTPQISQSNNLNQLQPSLSSEIVDDKSVIEHQSTEIINKSPSSTPEITHQAGEGFQNTTFPEESESTTSQISQSDNLNKLQTSLSSEAVDGNNLVKQQATDIINKSQSSASAEITNQVEAGFNNTTFSQEIESTTPQISQSDNLNQLQPSLSSEAVDDKTVIEQQSTDITNANHESSTIQLPVSQLNNAIQAQVDNSESELSYKTINTEENIVEINQFAQDNIQPQQYSTNNHQITTSETISTQDYTFNDVQAELTSVDLQRKEESNILSSSSQPKIENRQSILDTSTIQPSVNNEDIKTKQETTQISNTQETINQFALGTTIQPLAETTENIQTQTPSNIQPKPADSLQNKVSQQVDSETEFLDKQNQQLPTSSFPSSAIAPELQTDLTIEAASNQYISKKSLEGNTVKSLTSVEPNSPLADVSQTDTFNTQPETSITQAVEAASNENSSFQVPSANIVNKFSSTESVQPSSESIQAFTNEDNQNPTSVYSTSDNYSGIGTDNDSPQVENSIQRSSAVSESQSTIPTIEDNYSEIGTDINSPQVENSIQRSSVTEESQNTIPIIEDNYSEIGTDNDSPLAENTIQRSSVTEESQPTIPTIEENQSSTSVYSTSDNYSEIGTDNDSSQVENTIQRSSVTEESKNTIPTIENNYSQIGADTDSPQVENTIQRSSIAEESQNTIPTIENNYSQIATDINSPQVENTIQRSSIAEESQTTIPTIENNYSQIATDINSPQVENTIQRSSVTEESQTAIPTIEDNYSQIATDTDSPLAENTIQRSSTVSESQNTIPIIENNYSQIATDTDSPLAENTIQRSSTVSESQSTIPIIENNYSQIATDTDSPQVENTIQRSSVTEESQTAIPTIEDNYSQIATDTDSPLAENTIQRSSTVSESQSTIPIIENNYSQIATDTDSPLAENTIQRSSTVSESQNTIPIIENNYSQIATDTDSPLAENTIQRSSTVSESQSTIPIIENNYSQIATDTDSPQVENTIQRSSVTEESQPTIPTTSDNYSETGTDTDSPQVENLIQRSSVTEESQTAIPTTSDNYSETGTDTDSPLAENTIQRSSTVSESQNTIPIIENNYSETGTDTDSPLAENTIQRSSVTEESQSTIPIIENNYSETGTDSDSPQVENTIQRSSVTEESQNTIPIIEDNYSEIATDTDSPQVENTIQRSSVTEESQPTIPTIEDNYSSTGTDINSPQVENTIQRSSIAEESQNTIPTIEENQNPILPTPSSQNSLSNNSPVETDISYSETQSTIQPFSEANISDETVDKSIQAKDNGKVVYAGKSVENIDSNTDIIQTYLTTDNNIIPQNLVENTENINTNNTIQASTEPDSFVSDAETNIQRSVEQNIPQLPTVLQNLTVLDPLTSIDSPTQINQSPQNQVQRKVEKQLQPTSTVPEALINNASSSSGWSDFKNLVKGQTTPTRILRQTISQNNSKNHSIQAKSSENIATVRVSNQSSESKEQSKEVADATDKKALEAVAQVVYEQLKQRLRVEQERHGGGSHGRIGW